MSAEAFEILTPITQIETLVVTAHIPSWLKGVLYAEAIAANKPMSALLREWMEDHLDLPTSVQLH